MFSLADIAGSLFFELEFSSVSGGTVNPIAPNDSFQVGPFDMAGGPINPIDPQFLPAFYSIDSSGIEDLADGVTVVDLGNGRRGVSLDLISVPLQVVTLEFLMQGTDDGFASTAIVDSVTVAAVPEPGAFVWLVAVAGCAVWRGRRTSQPQSGMHDR